MSLFNKKEEKNKVGRPKLADIDTKKKAIIMIGLCLVMVLALLLTGAFKLNIIKFNKLKGSVTCTEIPARFQPKSETNPEGLHGEYGFTDVIFYSYVIEAYNNSNNSLCSDITEEQLNSITSVSVGRKGGNATDVVKDFNGIQYLTELKSLSSAPNIPLLVEKIDLSSNTKLETLTLRHSEISEINLENNSSITTLILNDNNLNSINLGLLPNLTYLDLESNDITKLDLSNNHNVSTLKLDGNPLKSLDLSGNIALTKFWWGNSSAHTKLDSINLSGMTALNDLLLSGNDFSELDLRNTPALKKVNLSNNGLTFLNLSNNLELESLDLNEENLNNLDLHNNDKLNSLNLKNAKFDKLDLTNNKLLTSLYLTKSEIGNLDLSGANNLRKFETREWYPNIKNVINTLVLKDVTNLTNLNLYYANVNKLDLSDATSLKYFEVPKGLEDLSLSNMIIEYFSSTDGNLKKVNINNMPQLKNLDLENNSINEFKIDNTSNLNTLYLNNNNLSSIDLSKMPSLKRGELSNNSLSKINLKNNISLAELNLSNNDFIGEMDLSNNINLESILIYNNKLNNVLLPHNNILNNLILSNNNLTGTLDLSKYNNLVGAYLDNNNLDNVILGNNEILEELLLHNNNLKKIDLSNVPNLNLFTIEGNPITNTIYLLKNKTLKYNKDIILNDNRKPVYDVNDNSLVLYENGMLKTLKEGITSVRMSNENISVYNIEFIDKCITNWDSNQEYCDNVSEEDVILPYFLTQEIKVYDIISEVYKIDKEQKTIDASGLDLDTSKIKITLEGLSTVTDKDNFIIKDGETVVDTYKILNMKKVVEKPSSDNNDDKTTTTKKPGPNNTNKETNNKKNTTNKTTTEDLSDIEINGSFVSILALQTIKGKDRNVVVKNDKITITINGKDIEKINGNLDLSYELSTIKESIIYNELKDKVTNGMVLSFRNNSKLPGKVLINVEVTDIIKKNAGTRNLRLYSYKQGELSLVAKNINPKNKILSFYVNELGSYVLTDKELEGKNIKEDTKLLESNNKINKGISFSCILWLILILIILGIIGYVVYEKNKDKNKND